MGLNYWTSYKGDQRQSGAGLKCSRDGMSCVILGLAPHLDEMDLSLLDGLCETFVCNRFYRSFPEPAFRPTYYICSDRRVWRREIELVEQEKVILLLGDILFDKDCPLHNWTPGRPPGKTGDPKGYGPCKKPESNWYGFRTIHRTNDVKVGYDPDYGFWNGGTVVYDALQWALFMGFNRIGVAGVELEWPSNPRAPTHAGGLKGQEHAAFPINTGYSLMYFNELAKVAESKDIQIFNLAPEGKGKLNVFPRISLESFADQ